MLVADPRLSELRAVLESLNLRGLTAAGQRLAELAALPEPAKPAQPAKLTGLAEPAQPAKLTGLAEPTELTEPEKPTEPAGGAGLQEEHEFWTRVVKFVAMERDPAECRRDIALVAALGMAGEDLAGGRIPGALERLTLPIWKLAQLRRLVLDPGDTTLARLLRTIHPGLSHSDLGRVAAAIVAAAPAVEGGLPGFLPHG